MAVTTRSLRRPAALFGTVALAALLVTVGCSSSKDDAASVGSTPGGSAAGTTPTTAGSTGSTGSTGTSNPSGSQATSPSTIPASVEGTCAALAETYGLDAIQPKNTISWVDERQRIVVDAQREAGLLEKAQQGAPSDVAARLATMQAYASWLATTVQGTGSFSQAVTAMESYPDQIGVSLAVAAVQTWRIANCPD
jgi:hypothetical protein